MAGDGYRVGVVGATGLVGTTILELLAARDFPAAEVVTFASARSAGRELASSGCWTPSGRGLEDAMRYDFLVDTYASERLKTLNVWSMFADADLPVRPHPRLDRDRTPGEHMVHQCMSEDKWFVTMFGIDVGAPPVPAPETRLGFIRRYAEDSEKRLAVVRYSMRNSSAIRPAAACMSRNTAAVEPLVSAICTS